MSTNPASGTTQKLDEILAASRKVAEEAKKIGGLEERVAKYETEVATLTKNLESVQASMRANSIQGVGVENEFKSGKASLYNIVWALQESARTGRHPSQFAPDEWDMSEKMREATENSDAMNVRHNVRQQRMAEMARTTQVAQTPSLGGFLVPTQTLTEKLYPLVYAQMILKDLGAFISTDVPAEAFEVPKFTGGTTGYWVGEETALTESNATFGNVRFSPKEVGALIAVSKRLSKYNPMVEKALWADMAQQIARAIEKASFVGVGSQFQPQGLFKGAGGSGTNSPWLQGALDSTLIGTDVDLGTNGGAMTMANALSFIGALQDNNTLTGNLGFAMHPKVLRKWQNDTTNQYNSPIPMSQDFIEKQVGYKIRTTTQIPVNITKGTSTDNCGLVVFGNWADLWIPLFSGIEMESSGSAYVPATSKSGLVHRINHAVVTQLVDIAPMRALSFAGSNEATTV